jgi:hypothetical protein
MEKARGFDTTPENRGINHASLDCIKGIIIVTYS